MKRDPYGEDNPYGTAYVAELIERVDDMITVETSGLTVCELLFMLYDKGLTREEAAIKTGMSYERCRVYYSKWKNPEKYSPVRLIKFCKHCGEKFTTTMAHKQFCSKECHKNDLKKKKLSLQKNKEVI